LVESSLSGALRGGGAESFAEKKNKRKTIGETPQAFWQAE
jgi:hypothetical protein